MTRSRLWPLKPHNIHWKKWPRSLINGLLPQKGAPFQIFPLLFFPHFFPLLPAHWGTSLIVTGGDYFSACCLECRLWQEQLTDCSPWYWIILNFSTLCNFLPPNWHQKMRKRFSLFYKGKIRGKYAVHFVVNVGKGVDKPVDTEGKCHWNEQYLKVMNFWALQ